MLTFFFANSSKIEKLVIPFFSVNAKLNEGKKTDK